jgi:hypothetical protein
MGAPLKTPKTQKFDMDLIHALSLPFVNKRGDRDKVVGIVFRRGKRNTPRQTKGARADAH